MGVPDWVKLENIHYSVNLHAPARHGLILQGLCHCIAKMEENNLN